MTESAYVSVRSLSRRFAPDAPAAVDDLSSDLRAGEIVALIGPSGCGKTTALRPIAGFETPGHGTIELAGRDIRMMQQGPAQEVHDCPANEFVAGFLGRTSLVTGLATGTIAHTILGMFRWIDLRPAGSRSACGPIMARPPPDAS